MSKHPRELHLVVNLDCGLPRGFGGNDKGCARHNDGELHDQFVAALNAAVDSDAITSSGFGFPNRCVEKFRRTHSVHDSMLVNSHFGPLNLEEFQNGGKGTNCKEIRRGIASTHFKLTCSAVGTNATRGRGAPLAALASSVSGHRRYLNPRRNQRSPKYVSAINMIDAPAIHHMRTAFWFVLQSSRSDSQSLRFAGATVCAIASSVRRTPASVPDRASVVSR